MTNKSNEARQIYLTHNGETKSLSEWAKLLGINKGSLWTRWKKGWPIDKVLSKRDERKNRPYRRRRDNHMVTYKGEIRPLCEWARLYKIKPMTLAYRLRAGWSIDVAMTTPTAELKDYGGLSVKFPSEHQAWQSMKSRCYKKRIKRYPNYGGRGIRVCRRWYFSFEKFFEDMGPKPSKRHQIDRIDNDGHYSKKNCRWALPKQQCRNRRSNVTLTYRGETLCIAEWSERTGIQWETIHGRIKRGWSIEQTLTIPATLKKPHVSPRL